MDCYHHAVHGWSVIYFRLGQDRRFRRRLPRDAVCGRSAVTRTAKKVTESKHLCGIPRVFGVFGLDPELLPGLTVMDVRGAYGVLRCLMLKAIFDQGETMKSLRVAGISARYWFSVLGWSLSQDAGHDVASFVEHSGKKVGHGTKSGVKDVGHGTKVVAKDYVKGVEKASKKTREGMKDAASK
jgi:hypothetical protein